MVLAAALAGAPLAAQGITGTVFLDANGNGRRDSGERGVAGVAVSDQDGVAVTDANGVYRLNGSATGIVFVSVPSGHRAVGAFWKTTQLASREGDFALAATPLLRTFRFVHASDTHISEQSAPRTQRLRAMVDSIG